MKIFPVTSAVLLLIGSACTRADPSSSTAEASVIAQPPGVAQVAPQKEPSPQHQVAGHHIPQHAPQPGHAQQPSQPQPDQPVTPQPNQPVTPQPNQPVTPQPLAQPTAPQPAPGVPTISRPDAVAACNQAADDWRRACGCPVKITIDVASMQGINDSYSEEDFEMHGKYFCQDISSGTDLHGHSVAIGTFCKGREKDMCKITSIKFTRAPWASRNWDCTFSNGTAVPHSNGETRSLVDNCYKHVTTW